MKIADKFARIETRLDSIDANLARHMKRSDALEAQVAPMLELRTEVKGVIKLLKFFGILAGVAECLHYVMHYLN